MYFTLLYYIHNAISSNSSIIQTHTMYVLSTYIMFDLKPGMTFHSPLKYIILLYFDPACVLTTRHDVDRRYFENICRYRSLEACI